MPPKAPPPKAKPMVDPSPSPPPKAPTGEDPGTTSPEFENSGTSTPKTIFLDQYNDLIAHFNQLQEAIAKVCGRKNYYKNETVSLSGSLTDNREALISANKIIKELEKEANELAETIGLDKDTILDAVRSDNNSSADDMTSQANVPPFSVRIIPTQECGLTIF